ncbi:hypothetical protein [Pseudomonas serbica]|uniref:hypothetical protein n=1 Tax=Pseudomonas serbica TaxID=2965074 RepID=UPI00237C43F2|nr:hypothetical protein [Pseudomonas serbica]
MLTRTFMRREGSAFDATIFRDDGDHYAEDIKFEYLLYKVPFCLQPALFGIFLGFSKPAITRFLSQAEVNLSDIAGLATDAFDRAVMIAETGEEFTLRQLQRYLIEAMVGCPVRTHAMIKELRSIEFSSTIVESLLHCEIPELWVTTRLGDETFTMQRLPKNIDPNLSYESNLDIPNHSFPDLLRRSGVLKGQFIRKVFAFHDFYEDVLINLRDGEGLASRIVNSLEFLEDDEVASFASGLINTVFIPENDRFGLQGEENSANPRPLFQVLKTLIEEMECYGLADTVTVALNYLPADYIGKLDRVQGDELYAPLHDFTSVLNRFCEELLDLDPLDLTLAHFTAMSKLCSFRFEDFDRPRLSNTCVLRHIACAVKAFKPFFSDVPTPKWELDTLVVAIWRDFADLFRDEEMRLKYDASEFNASAVLAMNMINEYDRKFPELGEDDQLVLKRYEALQEQ